MVHITIMGPRAFARALPPAGIPATHLTSFMTSRRGGARQQPAHTTATDSYPTFTGTRGTSIISDRN